MHALIALITAAESGGEHSKTPFYICGGLLAAWAVVLSLIGMSSETFPSSGGAQRGVIALTVLIVAAAMATAVITA
jgi:hypothetical protein